MEIQPAIGAAAAIRSLSGRFNEWQEMIWDRGVESQRLTLTGLAAS